MKHQNIHYYAIAFLFLVTIIPVNSLKAQSEFGVKGGTLFTGWRYDYSGNFFKTETKTGISAGVFYRINNLLGPVHLQAEFLYQLKGANTFISYNPDSLGYNPYGYGYKPYGSNPGYNSAYGYGNDNGPWITGQESFHYFTIPVLASVTAFKVIDFYAGPEIGYLFSSSKNRVLIYDDVEKFSAGVSAGIAIHLGVNTKLDFRYSTDFTSLYDTGASEFKNQSFAFTIQQTLLRKQAKY